MGAPELPMVKSAPLSQFPGIRGGRPPIFALSIVYLERMRKMRRGAPDLPAVRELGEHGWSLAAISGRPPAPMYSSASQALAQHPIKRIVPGWQRRFIHLGAGIDQ